jgi:hypothetical protein
MSLIASLKQAHYAMRDQRNNDQPNKCRWDK